MQNHAVVAIENRYGNPYCNWVFVCVCLRACVWYTVQYSARECVDNLISKRVRPFIINYLYGCQFSLVDGLFSCNFCIESATCIYALYAFCSVTVIGYVQIFLLSSNCLSQFVLLLMFFLFIFSIQLFRKTNALCNGSDRKNWLMYAWLNWRPMFHKPIAPVQFHYLFLWSRCTFQFRHIIQNVYFYKHLPIFYCQFMTTTVFKSVDKFTKIYGFATQLFVTLSFIVDLERVLLLLLCKLGPVTLYGNATKMICTGLKHAAV